MTATIQLGDIVVDVIQKDIKNVHLSVYPPTGRVRISAPLHMKRETIRVFAISKLGWIKQEQQKLREQERETPRETGLLFINPLIFGIIQKVHVREHPSDTFTYAL